MKTPEWVLNLAPEVYDSGKPEERHVLKRAGNYVINFHPSKVGLILVEYVNGRYMYVGDVYVRGEDEMF